MNINNDNYELWLLRYAEQELTAEERKEVALWLADHPEAAEDLSLYSEAPRLERNSEVHYTGAPLQHSRPLWNAALRWTAAAAVVAVLMWPAMRTAVAPAPAPTLVAENLDNLDIPRNPEYPDNPEIIAKPEKASNVPAPLIAIAEEATEYPENQETQEYQDIPEVHETPQAEQTSSLIYVDDLIVFEDEIPDSPSNIDILAAADVTYTHSSSNINPIGHFISTFIKANK